MASYFGWGDNYNTGKLSGFLPTELGKVGVNGARLQSFLLQGNSFSGTIPTQMATLNHTHQSFRLNSNSLSGTIPSWTGSLRLTEYWYLGDNRLSGTLPTELGGVSAVAMTFGQNKLSGYLPTELGQMQIASSTTAGKGIWTCSATAFQGPSRLSSAE